MHTSTRSPIAAAPTTTRLRSAGFAARRSRICIHAAGMLAGRPLHRRPSSGAFPLLSRSKGPLSSLFNACLSSLPRPGGTRPGYREMKQASCHVALPVAAPRSETDATRSQPAHQAAVAGGEARRYPCSWPWMRPLPGMRGGERATRVWNLSSASRADGVNGRTSGERGAGFPLPGTLGGRAACRRKPPHPSPCARGERGG